MKNLLIIAFVLFLSALVQPLLSQTTEDYFSLELNSDAFGGMGLGYSKNPDFLSDKNLQFYMRLSFPLLLTAKNKSFDTWGIMIGARSELYRKNKFGAIGDIQLFMIHHQQILGEFMPLGMNLRFTPCHHFFKGYLGFQMNWNQTLATHISHSQYVKNTFSDLNGADKRLIDIHPKDGWYDDTGSHVSFGLEGAWELNRQFTFYGDLGLIEFSSLYTGLFDAMMMGQVPFYGNLRLLYRM